MVRALNKIFEISLRVRNLLEIKFKIILSKLIKSKFKINKKIKHGNFLFLGSNSKCQNLKN